MTQMTEAKSEEEVKHITKQLLNKTEKIKSIFTSSSQTKKKSQFLHIYNFTQFLKFNLFHSRGRKFKKLFTQEIQMVYSQKNHMGCSKQFSNVFLKEEIKFRII